MRHADEFPVGKHGAGAFATVVEHHIDPLRLERFVHLVGLGTHGIAAVHAYGANHHGKRGDGVGPNDAALVVVLLDRCCGQARDANAVATHFKGFGLAVFVEEGGVHGLGVLGTQVKNMAHFNAPLDGQHAFAIGRGVTVDHVAHIGHHLGLGQIAAPVDTANVVTFDVGTANPIGHDRHLAIDHQAHGLLQVQRTQIARLATKVRLDFGHGGKAPTLRKHGQLAHFDFVHVVIATHQQQPHLAAHDLACFVERVGGQHQGLDGALQGQAQQLGHFGAGAATRRGNLGHGFRSCSGWAFGGQGLGLFHVGGVIALGAIHNGVFAGRRNHLELF